MNTQHTHKPGFAAWNHKLWCKSHESQTVQDCDCFDTPANTRNQHTDDTRPFDPLTDDWKQRPDAYAKWAVESFNKLHRDWSKSQKQLSAVTASVKQNKPTTNKRKGKHTQ